MRWKSEYIIEQKYDEESCVCKEESRQYWKHVELCANEVHMIWTWYFSAVNIKDSLRGPFVWTFRIKTEKSLCWTVTLGKRIVSLYIFGSFNKFYKQFMKILIQSECTFLLHTVDSANSFLSYFSAYMPTTKQFSHWHPAWLSWRLWEVEPPISLHAEPYVDTVRRSGDKGKSLSRFAAWGVRGWSPGHRWKFQMFLIKTWKITIGQFFKRLMKML